MLLDDRHIAQIGLQRHVEHVTEDRDAAADHLDPHVCRIRHLLAWGPQAGRPRRRLEGQRAEDGVAPHRQQADDAVQPKRKRVPGS